jgi:hypothetical protein
MAYTVGIALALMAFQACPAASAALQWFNVFMIGFFLYGGAGGKGAEGARARARRRRAGGCLQGRGGSANARVPAAVFGAATVGRRTRERPPT